MFVTAMRKDGRKAEEKTRKVLLSSDPYLLWLELWFHSSSSSCKSSKFTSLLHVLDGGGEVIANLDLVQY